jgi:hypothetical protein
LYDNLSISLLCIRSPGMTALLPSTATAAMAVERSLLKRPMSLMAPIHRFFGTVPAARDQQTAPDPCWIHEVKQNAEGQKEWPLAV